MQVKVDLGFRGLDTIRDRKHDAEKTEACDPGPDQKKRLNRTTSRARSSLVVDFTFTAETHPAYSH